MKVIVSLMSGRRKEYNVEPDDKISKLMDKLEEDGEGRFANNTGLGLKWAGKELYNHKDKTFKNVGITRNSTLFMASKPTMGGNRKATRKNRKATRKNRKNNSTMRRRR